MSDDHVYDLIVLGATGFTGKLIAEYITQHLPNDLKWAVAGRNGSKLHRIVEGLRALRRDRLEPEVEQVQLEVDNLKALVTKAKVVINAVGPFHLYGAPVVEACATTGTHYLDITGEIPFVYEMIKKFDTIARSNGAIIIPQIGFDSSPADMLAWTLVNHMRSQNSTGLREVITSLDEVNGTASGGTLASAIGIFEQYSLKELAAAMAPYALSPVRPEDEHPEPLSTRLFGLKTVRSLGALTSNPLGPGDVSIVHRSWGLFDEGYLYGKNFVYRAHMRARNALTAVLFHVGLSLTMGLLALVPPLRLVARKFVTQPGDGPSTANDTSDSLQIRSIGYSDSQPVKRAMATLRYAGGPYHYTALSIVEAAMVLLHGQPTEAHRMSGGVLTPATLGGQFVDRLNKAGAKIDVRMLDD